MSPRHLERLFGEVGLCILTHTAAQEACLEILGLGGWVCLGGEGGGGHKQRGQVVFAGFLSVLVDQLGTL